MTRKTLYVIAGVVLALVGSMIFNLSERNTFAQIRGPLRSQFRTDCGPGLLLGRYAYKLEGTLPGTGPVRLVGVLTHSQDDSGNFVLSGADTFNADGQIIPRTYIGTYDVAFDCSGTGSYTDSLGHVVNYKFAVGEAGNTLYLIGTDPGTQVSGVATRIDSYYPETHGAGTGFAAPTPTGIKPQIKPE
ncbi:MAG TPA: hypothetical protein VFD58_07305 [Blastocatellia bacterium]|nr:hypothetical protein [Blastocatellia bacterium]